MEGIKSMNWGVYSYFLSSEEIKRAVQFCEDTECENCRIAIEGLDYRSEYEKSIMQIPCVENLLFELVKEKLSSKNAE